MKNLGLIAYFGFFTATALSFPVGFNLYNNHNVDYRFEDRRVMRKVDGIFDNTEVEVYDKGKITVRRDSPYRSYTDKDGDGYLDWIYITGNRFGRGPETESMDLVRHDPSNLYEGHTLKNYPEVFAKAEKEFKEQLERFGLKPLLNRKI